MHQIKEQLEKKFKRVELKITTRCIWYIYVYGDHLTHGPWTGGRIGALNKITSDYVMWNSANSRSEFKNRQSFRGVYSSSGTNLYTPSCGHNSEMYHFPHTKNLLEN